jgi:YVTN family beta-propeller protein
MNRVLTGYSRRLMAQNAPSNSRPLTCGHLVWPKVLFAVVLGILLASSASSQYLEATIMLPDTLGPLNGPYHLAWDENLAHPRLYIGGEGDSGGVIVAQALTCERMARISTGPVKALCFVAPHAKLYVANARSDSIKVVDCATNQVTSTVCVAGESPILQYNHLNDRLYCGGSSISVIDCAADTVIHTIAVAANVLALDSADNKLFAGGDEQVAAIDCGPDSMAAVLPRIDSVGALCYNPTAGKVYATSRDTLYAVRTQDDSLVAALYFGGLVPRLACNPATNRIYFVDGISWLYLRSIDCANDSAVLRSDIGQFPYSLTCNAARDMVYFGSYGEVGLLDGSSGQVLKWIITQSSTDCGWCPALNRLFCPPVWRETEPPAKLCLLSTVDGSRDTVCGFLPLTMHASSISLDTVHNRLYFAYPSLRLGCVGVVDCDRNVVVSYKLVPRAEAVCYNPNNDRAYWGTEDLNAGLFAVTVYDCTAESVLKSVPVHGPVHAFRLHETLNKLYVETWDPGLCIIDCRFDSVLAYVPWPDNYPRIQFLVPEDNRYWYLGPGGVIVVDCIGDTVVTNVQDHIGSIDEACACSAERKIYTSDGQVIDMDKPGQVDSIQFWGNRFCYLPSERKLYACTNDYYDRYFLVLDTRSDTVIARFSSPCQVSGMCLDHTGGYIYCAGYEDSLMFVIDARADSIVATFRVTTTAAARDPLAVNRLAGRIYEAGYAAQNGIGIPVVRDSMLAGIEESNFWTGSPEGGSTVVSRSGLLRVSVICEFWDATGRRVAVLRPGLNAISHLAPGVYFVREEPQATGCRLQAARKIVVAR